MISWTIVALALFVLSFYHFYWKRRRLPPGPTPWPLIGNFPVILWRLSRMRIPIKNFVEWRRRYGPIYTLWLCEKPVVVVVDHKLMVEMFQKDGANYADRLDLDGFKRFTIGARKDIVVTNGEVWREHRRFFMNFLRDCRAGRNLMQEKILTDVRERFDAIDVGLALSDRVPITDLFDIAIGSIIFDLVFGQRFDEANSQQFSELKRLNNDMLSRVISLPFGLIAAQPFLGRLPYLRQVGRRSRECFRNFFAFIRQQIDARVAETEASELDGPAENFVDAFLNEKRRRDLAGELGHSFTMEQLEGVCINLWVAGQETTAALLSWTVAFVLRHLDVQRKIHDELDTVIGDSDVIITVADMIRLPYVNAVINEAHRLSIMVPINLPRQTVDDVTVRGYVLPRGTCVIAEFPVVFYDDTIFADPTKFKPERFLTADGKLGKCDELIPFSLGKRQCPGEALARMELFLFVANLFNRYTLWMDGPPLSSTYRLSVVFACSPFDCHLKRRRKAN